MGIPAGGVIRYNRPAMSMGSDSIVANGKALLAQLDHLDSLKPKIMAAWQGDAVLSWADVQRRWDATAGQLRAAVNALGLAVGTSGVNMGTTEKINAGRFNGSINA